MKISEIYKAIGAGKKFQAKDTFKGNWFDVAPDFVEKAVDQYIEHYNSKPHDDIPDFRLVPIIVPELGAIRFDDEYTVEQDGDFVTLNFNSREDADMFYSHTMNPKMIQVQ